MEHYTTEHYAIEQSQLNKTQLQTTGKTPDLRINCQSANIPKAQDDPRKTVDKSTTMQHRSANKFSHIREEEL